MTRTHFAWASMIILSAATAAFVGCGSDDAETQDETPGTGGSDADGSAFENFQVWCRAILRADVQLARADAFAKIVGIIPPAA